LLPGRYVYLTRNVIKNQSNFIELHSIKLSYNHPKKKLIVNRLQFRNINDTENKNQNISKP